MWHRDIYSLTSSSQSLLHDGTDTANNWITGISSNYRTYTPSSSKYPSVAATRSGNFDPQKSFSNISGTGRYTTFQHWYANSSSLSNNGNRVSYLTPSGSRPNAYYWGQDRDYIDSIKGIFSNQFTNGLNFYRFSDGNKVVIDQFKNTDFHWIFYNHSYLDNNILNISTAGAISKLEQTTDFQDNTTNSSTPFLFQTHGGMGANNGGTMVTDYARDAYYPASDRDTYIIYKPNFGSNTNISTNIETMGEWRTNVNGERSGS